MSDHAKTFCRDAQRLIVAGQYADAIAYLRLALRQTTNRRAWSKLMLAIRELSCIVPAVNERQPCPSCNDRANGCSFCL